MSVNLSEWLGAGAPISESGRAALAWRRIQHKPTSVSFRTPAGVTLAAQQVRIESDTSATMAESAAGAGAKRKVIVFGIKGHSSLSDTNVEEGYRFVLNNDEYRCVDVIDTIGERQAFFESVG